MSTSKVTLALELPGKGAEAFFVTALLGPVLLHPLPHYASLELMAILQSQPPECWEYGMCQYAKCTTAFYPMTASYAK